MVADWETVFSIETIDVYVRSLATSVETEYLSLEKSTSESSLSNLRSEVRALDELLSTVPPAVLPSLANYVATAETITAHLPDRISAVTEAEKEQIMQPFISIKAKSDVVAFARKCQLQATDASAKAEYDSAIVSMKKAIKLMGEYCQNEEETAVAHYQLARLYEKKGRTSDAENHYWESHRILTTFYPSSMNTVKTCSSLSHFFLSQKRPQEAKSGFAYSLWALQSYHTEDSEIPVVSNTLGTLCYTLGEKDEAETHLLAAFRLWKAANDPRAKSLAFYPLSKLYEEQGNTDALNQLITQVS